LAGDLANPGRQLINSSEELINETDPLINWRDQLTNSSAKLINLSGELINGNDSLIKLGDQLTNSSEELINWSEELVNVSEELINWCAESLDPSTLSVAETRHPAGPGDFLVEDRTNLRAHVKNLDRRWKKCPTQTAKEVGMGNPTEETVRAGQQNSYARPEPPPSRKFNPARGIYAASRTKVLRDVKRPEGRAPLGGAGGARLLTSRFSC
jgi:hypothetical protein